MDFRLGIGGIMARGRKTSRQVRWKPSRVLRNFFALNSLHWRYTKPRSGEHYYLAKDGHYYLVGSEYDDFDIEIYRGDIRVAYVMRKWNDITIMTEVEWGLFKWDLGDNPHET
jgi:hypothetical protein